MNEPPPKPARRVEENVLVGILIGLGLHFAMAMVVYFTALFRSYGGLGAILGFGLFQFVYMGPAMILARIFGCSGVLKGLTLVAALTFLANAACWGAFALTGG